jgi:hypothetical protein
MSIFANKELGIFAYLLAMASVMILGHRKCGVLGRAKLIFRTINRHRIMITLGEKELIPWTSEF